MRLFQRQLNIIKNALNNDTILLSDFNSDWSHRWVPNYSFKNYFKAMDYTLTDTNLIQLVKIPTWSRTINGIVKTSILDPVYLNNPTIVNNLSSMTPTFGDHQMVVIDLLVKSNIILFLNHLQEIGKNTV
jgi:hypothetical protein